MNQVQVSECPGNELTSKNPLPFDVNRPITIPKRTMECTKHSLNLISKFVPFDRYFYCTKSFLWV